MIHAQHTHVVIDTTHKTIEPDLPTEMLTHTYKQTDTHRRTHKQKNVIHIAKGYPKEKEKEKKSGGALLDSDCGCCKKETTKTTKKIRVCSSTAPTAECY